MARKDLKEQIREGEERLKQLKAKAAQIAARERASLREKERKADAQRKIQFGGLVVLAGLADLDKGVLLGGLIAMAEQLKGEHREQFIARCKARGDHLLASQAATNEKSAAAQAQNKEQEA